MGTLKKLKIVYVLFPAKFSLKKPIAELLKCRLIVCANVIQGIESHYIWQGNIEKSKETAVFFKTLASREKELRAAIAKFHPYEVPFIAVIALESVNTGYLNYAMQQQSNEIK